MGILDIKLFKINFELKNGLKLSFSIQMLMELKNDIWVWGNRKRLWLRDMGPMFIFNLFFNYLFYI